MTFPPNIREEALVAAARHCCLCHRYRGTKIECHHIVETADGGPDTFDNCIPLCFDCHSEMTSYDFKHPKGTKFTPSELTKHRDLWYQKVSQSGGVVAQPAHRDVDTQVFNELRDQLPWDGLFVWLKDFNFAGFSFPVEKIEPLYRYQYYADDPANAFLDAEMEAGRGAFVAAVRRFNSAIGRWTFPAHNKGFNSVPADWELDSPDSFNEAVSGIHDAATAVVEHYSTLVQLGRRRLAVK